MGVAKLELGNEENVWFFNPGIEDPGVALTSDGDHFNIWRSTV